MQLLFQPHVGIGEGEEQDGQLQTVGFAVTFSVTWDDGNDVCPTGLEETVPTDHRL